MSSSTAHRRRDVPRGRTVLIEDRKPQQPAAPGRPQGRRPAPRARPVIAPPARALRPAGVAVAALSAHGVVPAREYAPDDVAERRKEANELWVVLFLFALVALAVHGVLKSGRMRQLQELARSLAFLASAYLAGFFFLASVSAVARFLHLLLGVERETSGLIAVPIGLVLACWIYTAYEKWRAQESPRRK
ncbi:hypothetical protein [Caldimonas tepidiphila]|uniref:hypothetical protein n=1 Tax=Caldimonas tepidiphila TaxID=2315841 RepID=UPI00130034EE|nr:hypothetical protein [Caldimonas tepidiphila]